MATITFEPAKTGDGENGERNQIRRTLSWKVTATGPDAPTIGYDDIYYNPGLPFGILDTYSWGGYTINGLICLKVNVTRTDSAPGKWWGLLTCEFGTLAGDKGQDPTQQDPILRFPKWGTRQSGRQVLAYKDLDGRPYVNSAMLPFQTPVMHDRPISVVWMTRNEMSFSAALAQQYWNQLNSATFWGGPIGTVKCNRIDASKTWEHFGLPGMTIVVGYWEVTYEFAYDKFGWEVPILDCGIPNNDAAGAGTGSLNQPWGGANPNGPILCPPKTPAGIPILIPVPLDGAGKALGMDRIAAGNLVFLGCTSPNAATLTDAQKFRSFDKTDFNQLNLPYPS